MRTPDGGDVEEALLTSLNGLVVSLTELGVPQSAAIAAVQPIRSALRSARESVPASDAMAAVRAVLRHAKEREAAAVAAAVERTVEKVKAIVVHSMSLCQDPESLKHLQRHILHGLNGLKDAP